MTCARDDNDRARGKQKTERRAITNNRILDAASAYRKRKRYYEIGRARLSYRRATGGGIRHG